MKHERRSILCSCLLGAGVFGVAYLGLAEWRVVRAAAGRVHTAVADTPTADVALVLGTARTVNGRRNFFYDARMKAAAELFHAGRVRGILVSGDNSRRAYDEPSAMKADLLTRGVPAEFITCDYAGFSTLDSVKRASRVFGQRRVLFVSQRFHVERALFLARADGLEASGFAAAEAPAAWRLRVRAREVFARGKALIDVRLGRGPKFLGPREPVGLTAGATSPSACPRL